MRDLVQKALYLGVGIASYAAEKAGGNLQELKAQAQKIADDLVARGEMTTDEARRYVDDLMREAQSIPNSNSEDTTSREPRRIEIVSDTEEEESPPPSQVDDLRQQVSALQEELRRLGRQ